jgi:antibiotic biosynthesis monooxygenase (ABM) superfamily enzyme
VLAGAALTSVLMVLGMTYVIVPVLTGLFQAWLDPPPIPG